MVLGALAMFPACSVGCCMVHILGDKFQGKKYTLKETEISFFFFFKYTGDSIISELLL
jgi:hypothetical protein